ncbi:hypothetical protein HGRIS_009091 [Hohenbuehelia grisea]|uniref:Fungal N-terminal domain-containing protein n=1 Tax=Hohenbuehelia grisea TaxID=104357 RepID=A0ABR3J0I8_9AGAR
MEALGAASSIIAVVAVTKDVVKLALSLKASFKEVEQNREEIALLANRVINFMGSLASTVSESTYSMSATPNLIPAVQALKSDLHHVILECQQQTISKGKFTEWALRDIVSSAIQRIQRSLSMCMQMSNTLSGFRMESRLVDLHQKVDMLADVLRDKLSAGENNMELAQALVKTSSMSRVVMKRSLKRAQTYRLKGKREDLENRYLELKIQTLRTTLQSTSDEYTPSGRPATPTISTRQPGVSATHRGSTEEKADLEDGKRDGRQALCLASMWPLASTSFPSYSATSETIPHQRR